ncbi:ABC transporter permease [Streptomyces sp. VRA16 Mangrove soil]|uniref:ABC transporter permease n=1 Tax=Streptomyces sp. VRA16 Mangrove soil TaxID=2817434 RepID=UPI001A9FCC39|nr:ABC transporter permease [Streptomyces sp. VRA16 Mangrove soil]MBO1333682.1 ABC transporter permease [Streptomyces sp. VRA16 Mangrove soil]
MTAAGYSAARGGSRQLAGTGVLLRLALRRDRLMIPLWVYLVALTVITMPKTLKGIYATPAERADVLTTMSANSSLRALYGPALDDSLGGLTVWRVGAWTALFAAAMSLLIVVRHTRDEEESGRQEMVSAAMVGRRAPLTSALLAAFVANATVAVLITVGMTVTAGEGVAGALALGLATGGVGMVFASLAAIVAQFTESARLARGLSAGLLGVAFVLRAAGDAGSVDGSSVLTWLSPIGWLENTRAYAGERWWVLLLFGVAVLAQGALAYVLAGRRDIGMSFVPSRPGPANGRLGSAGALAWRLQRGSVIGWSLAFLASGAALGGVTNGATDLVGDNADTRDIIERMGGQSGITDAFLAAMVGMLGMVAALYVVQSVLRMYGEETSQRAEPVLSGAVGRLRWAAGHLTIAFAGAVLILLCGGLGLAAGYGHEIGPILGASLVQLPAVWALGAVAVLLYGFAPQAAVGGGWGVAGAALLIGWIGPALKLPQAVMDLSPFGHLPKLPGGDMAWGPVLVLCGIAVVLVGAGLAGLRRRDLST